MYRFTVVKFVIIAVFGFLALGFSSLIYFSYQDYVNPKHVYGTWVEIGTPAYNTETLTFDANGVFRNHRLISTTFEFDGEKIHLTTGSGSAIYQIAGTFDSPQLRRLEPAIPVQRFVKKGYEDTVDMEGGGGAKQRRAALTEHFGSK